MPSAHLTEQLRYWCAILDNITDYNMKRRRDWFYPHTKEETMYIFIVVSLHAYYEKPQQLWKLFIQKDLYSRASADSLKLTTQSLSKLQWTSQGVLMTQFQSSNGCTPPSQNHMTTCQELDNQPICMAVCISHAHVTRFYNVFAQIRHFWVWEKLVHSKQLLYLMTAAFT